jgi:alkylhydroperoxidase family enzyme
MPRIAPSPTEVYAPVFGEQAPARVQIYAQRPEIAAKFVELGQVMRDHHLLPGRLLELVRLRVAFHNQCRSCMSVRYSYGLQDGLTEGDVCSLERPEEAEDLTDAERAAIAYADLMATNHLLVDDSTFDRLRTYYSDAEMMELCFHVAYYVGFGRMAMSLNMVDDIPEGYRADGVVAPWGQDDFEEVGGWSAGEATPA